MDSRGKAESTSGKRDKAGDVRVRSRSRYRRYCRQLARNCKKIFPESETDPDRSGAGRTLSPMRVAGARQSCRNIRAGQNPRPITNTPSHRAVSHQSAEYFSLGQLNNSTRRRTVSGWARVGWVLMYLPLPGGFQRLTGKSSDERLTRFSRYSSAIKLPSTIPPAIKLVRGDTKPSERLRFGPRIIQ